MSAFEKQVSEALHDPLAVARAHALDRKSVV